MAKRTQYYYLGWRGNPQLSNGGYYIAYGQLTKKAAKEKESCVYGSCSLTGYENEALYEAAIQEKIANGDRVNRW